MLSLIPLTILSASSIGLVAAQAFIPDDVADGTRKQWCVSQTQQCPLICTQYPGESAATTANDCDKDTLVYNCVCASNGLAPNVSEYSQTIPYFICTENNSNCVTACNGASACQSSCRENNPCGAQDPKRVNESTATASASKSVGAAASTAADGAVYTGFGDSGSSSSDEKDDEDSDTIKTTNAAGLLGVGQFYGAGVVMVCILTGASVLL